MMSVKQCSICQEETEYYCSSCQNDLCRHCKTAHVIDLYTRHHIVTTYRAKYNMYMYLPKQDVCLIHRNYICNKYRESELPKNESCYRKACFFPTKRNQQKQCSIKTFYLINTRQHIESIQDNGSETLYNRRVLLKGIKSDIETFQTKISQCQSEMLMRGQRVDHLFGSVLGDIIHKYKLFVQKVRMNLSCIQNYENSYVKCDHRPVQFLRFIKKRSWPSPNTKRNSFHTLSILSESGNQHGGFN